MDNLPLWLRSRNRRLVALCLVLGGLLAALLLAYRDSPARALPSVDHSRPFYGINFITSAEDRAPGSGRTAESLSQQMQDGLASGATWDRWPLYWFNIEQNPDQFNWSTQDAAVAADIAAGLSLNAILLGTPPFYTTSLQTSRFQDSPRPGGVYLAGPEQATPVGLFESVFDDGTDVPGPGKGINPANKWARFVAAAVERYRPGGVLAQASGWPEGVGITHWEMWNEPDLNSFWDSSLEDYARLLKVGYLSAKHTDPAAVVLFGALANNFDKLDYYRDVLTVFDNDPLAAQFDYFHDVLPTHSYFYAWQSFFHVFRARNTMGAFGLDKPIWLNETGVPAWNDYPGPVWDSQSALRATMEEQASFVIQSAFYGLFAGAESVFHFQLYDGCGNQPQGTDFPPHNGELCEANGDLVGRPGFPCAGDANGLFRNPTDAACFTQHPDPGSPRPNQTAFVLLTTHMQDVEPYWRKRPGPAQSCLGPGFVQVPPQEWIAFYREATQERIVGMWTLCGEDQIAELPATSPTGQATLIRVDGTVETISASGGIYSIPLSGATNRNPFPGQGENAIYPIGGVPVLVIEADDREPTATERLLLPVVLAGQ